MFLGKSVAVVVPAYNEARLLPRTLASIPDFVDLVVVVDDGSVDATAAVARTCGAPERLRVVRHEYNRGVGAALATGYREAVEAGAQIIAVMAGDAQMDPADLPALLAPIAHGRADYAKGDRLAHPDVHRLMPLWRLCGGVVLSWLTRLTSGYWTLRDSQCGYTAISREALLALPLDRLYPRYGYPNDLLAWLNALGQRLEQVPVRPVYGDETSGIHPLWIIPRLGFVLVRSLTLRVWHKHLRRNLPPPAPARGLLR